MKRIVVRLCLLVAFTTSVGMAPAAAQAHGTTRVPPVRGAPPPGRLIAVDGVRLHLHCVGSGSPTVVIEAGAGAWSLAWLHVADALAPVTRTCVHDRAGLGWSDDAAGPRTAGRAARDLRALLEAAGEEPPLALVGHSYGGWVVRIFADLFREDVAGVALVESAHPDQWERLPPVVKRLLDSTLPAVAARADSAAAGTLTARDVAAHAFFSRDPSLDLAYRAEMADPAHYRTYLAELRGMGESADRVRDAGNLAGVPLVVLSSAREFDPYRGTPVPVDEANRIWLELQQELSALSTDAVHLVSRTAPHTVQYAEPWVVVGAIGELVQRIRAAAGTHSGGG